MYVCDKVLQEKRQKTTCLILKRKSSMLCHVPYLHDHP